MKSIFYNGKFYEADSLNNFIKQVEADGDLGIRLVADKFMKEFNPVQAPKDGKSFSEVVNGAKAVVNVIKGEVAPQEEISRRAMICTSCPLKKETTDCVACGFGSRLATFINRLKKEVFTEPYKIPNGIEREYCSVCSCSLAMMIPSKMSAFNEDENKQEKRPDYCWVKKTSPNYKE